MYRVLSDRLPEPPGAVVDGWPDTDMAALVVAGHLEHIQEPDDEPVAEPKKRGAR